MVRIMRGTDTSIPGERTVLSPCFVNGETVLVEVDLDACPITYPVFTCTASVRNFAREDLRRWGR